MKTLRTSLLALVLVAFAALALAACGGGDDDDDSGGDNTQATATQAPAGDATDSADETATPEGGDDPTATAGGGDDSSASDAVISDPCSLVSKADVEAALGESVQDPVVTYTGTASVSGQAQAQIGTCGYVSPNGVPSANLTVWSAPGENDAIDGMIGIACGGKEEVDLGDTACWYDSNHVEIQAAKGGYFLDIFVTMNGDASDALMAITETAVDALP